MSYKDLVENIEKQWEVEEKAKEKKNEYPYDPFSTAMMYGKIKFYLYCKENRGISVMGAFPNPGTLTITLDNEDLQYLHSKYKPKVREEEIKEKQKQLDRKLEEISDLESKLDKLRLEIDENYKDVQ